MSNKKSNTQQETFRVQGGYKPSSCQNGYKPQKQPQSTPLPKAPKGGTGESACKTQPKEK